MNSNSDFVKPEDAQYIAFYNETIIVDDITIEDDIKNIALELVSTAPLEVTAYTVKSEISEVKTEKTEKTVKTMIKTILLMVVGHSRKKSLIFTKKVSLVKIIWMIILKFFLRYIISLKKMNHEVIDRDEEFNNSVAFEEFFPKP